MNTTVLILAAGDSTRMKSSLAKVFHPVAGLPILYRLLNSTLPVSDRTGIVLGRNFEFAKANLSSRFPDLHLFHQQHRLGTGHAVLQASDLFNNTDADHYLLILPGDLPLLTTDTLRKFIRDTKQAKPACSILAFEPDDPSGYGRLVVDNGKFTGIVEEKDADTDQKRIRTVNSGVYLMQASLLDTYLNRLENTNAQKEYYLTDIPGMMQRDGRNVVVHTAPDANDLMGVNNRIQLARADQIAVARHRNKLMLSGVTMISPETVRVEETVQVDPDVELHPNSQLLGHCVIRSHVTIGSGSILRDTQVESHVRILPYCVIEKSVIGSHSQVGPMAHLRPETHLGSNVKVGNFVESKKARLGDGVKASHLSYLGDTEIGSETNIGAGTITCNYDGEQKHLTRIGHHVFIGSDTQLVAPVSVGDYSYVGAGSTITKDVPACALGISRSKQTNIPDWPRKKGKKCNNQN